MGGVAPGELWRIALVLINTLFFSLSMGLVISAFGLQERNVMLATLASIVLVTFGLPGAWKLASRFSDSRWLDFLLLFPSPVYVLKNTASGLFVRVRSDFWP